MKEDIKEKIIKVIDRLAFFFFIVLVFFLPISNAAIESSFGFIYFFFLLRSIIKRPAVKDIKKFFRNRVNLSLLVFYIAIGLSLFVSGSYFKKSFGAWLFKWGEGVLLFYFAQIFIKKENIKFLLAVFFSSCLLVNMDSIYQRVYGIDLLKNFSLLKMNGFTASTATFHHYNDFAAYLVPMFFILFGLFLYLRRVLPAVILFPTLALIFINMFFTYSRGGWTSFIIAGTLLAIFSKDKKMKLFSCFFLFLFMLIVVIFPAMRERFLCIFQPGGDASRFNIWKGALAMFKESPFLGKGLGLFMDYINKYATGIQGQYAHNSYLQILAETGILGLLSFLWFLGEVIIRSYKKLRKAHDYILSGLLLGLLAFLIHSFFDTQLYSLKLSILFWVLVSLLAIYINNGSKDNFLAEIKINKDKA